MAISLGDELRLDDLPALSTLDPRVTLTLPGRNTGCDISLELERLHAPAIWLLA